MARKRKSSPQVRPGDAFLMPLEDGRFGVCRVLRLDEDSNRPLVAASPWVGTEPPDLADPQLRTILHLTHHSWKGDPEVLWVVDNPVPETFRPLGVIPPTKEDNDLVYGGAGEWVHFPIQVLMQWRWDHERDKVLAEEAAERQQADEFHDKQRRAYRPLPKQTLEQFRKQIPFPDWADDVEAATLRKARRSIRDAVDALIALHPEGPESAKIDVFRICVEYFNQLQDEEFDIDTIAREDIWDLLSTLAGLVDLDDYGEALINNRDW